jgi:hypothetical protein
VQVDAVVESKKMRNQDIIHHHIYGFQGLGHEARSAFKAVARQMSDTSVSRGREFDSQARRETSV